MRRSAGSHAAEGETLVRVLCQAHGAAVLAYAHRMTGDPRLAENVFQETMIRAWRAADALSTSAHPVRTWLFATCRGVVAEQARRRNVPPPPMGDGLPVDLRRVTSRTGQR